MNWFYRVLGCARSNDDTLLFTLRRFCGKRASLLLNGLERAVKRIHSTGEIMGRAEVERAEARMFATLENPELVSL
jgi:hypothetical protein